MREIRRWPKDFIKKVQVTHWVRVMHICVSKLTIIGSDSGLISGWRQAIIWTNTGVLSIGIFATNFNESVIEFFVFSFKKMHFKMSSEKWLPFCLGLNTGRDSMSRSHHWCSRGQIGHSYADRHNIECNIWDVLSCPQMIGANKWNVLPSADISFAYNILFTERGRYIYVPSSTFGSVLEFMHMGILTHVTHFAVSRRLF